MSPFAEEHQLDTIDRKLLELLQQDAARPLHEIGDLVGLSPSAVQRRLARYKSSGLIDRQIAVLNAGALPGIVLACVFVRLERECVSRIANSAWFWSLLARRA